MFPYSVGGIIILGLIVSSIRKFAQEISRENIIKPAAEKRRVKTIDRSVTTTVELEQRQTDQTATGPRLTPFLRSPANVRHTSRRRTSKNGMKLIHRIRSRNQKLLLLQEEKDRFDAMREIQRSTSNFKKYSALTMSLMACKLLFVCITFRLAQSLSLPRGYCLRLRDESRYGHCQSATMAIAASTGAVIHRGHTISVPSKITGTWDTHAESSKLPIKVVVGLRGDPEPLSHMPYWASGRQLVISIQRAVAIGNVRAYLFPFSLFHRTWPNLH